MKEIVQSLREKKVEYLELIYDLIFVYIIGRNNSLLIVSEGEFITGERFAAYFLATLAVIQIWSFSTFYTNMFGRNGVRDHVFMFLNMYLLYYIGEATHSGWESYHTQYHIAWALILVNIGAQYLIEMRHHRDDPDVIRTIRRMGIVLFSEAALVVAALFLPMGSSVIPILFGIGMTAFFADDRKITLIDFSHLSERIMLYVVFTFGEMIIAVAGYFEGAFTLRSFYFSLMGFLIIVALFLSYEMLYNHIIDRELRTTGVMYMLIHIFLIFSMNNLTVALEFMRKEEVSLMPKTLFLVGSFLLFFVCLIALMRYSKSTMKLCRRFLLPVIGLTVGFVAAMLIFREHMVVNILLSVVYVFGMFLRFYLYGTRPNNPSSS